MEESFEEKALTGEKAVFMDIVFSRLLELFSTQFMMDPAIACGEQALAYCQKEPTLSQEIPIIYYHIGKQYDKKGNKDIARDYYTKAIKGISNPQNVVYRDIISTKALCDYQVGLGIEQSLNDIRQLFVLSNNNNELLTRYMTIGAIYSEEGIYDSALRYLEPVFENKDDKISQIQAANYLRFIYDSIGDQEKSNECTRFLADFKKTEGENKAMVSKLEDLFKEYMNQKQKKEAEEMREMSIKKTIGIIVPIAIVAALFIIVFAKLKGKKLLKEQQEEAKRALEEAGRQHEQELIQQREEALAAERTHRIQQSSLSNRLKRSNEELRELKDQIRQQADSMNTKQEAQALSFNDEPICRLIMERVNDGQFKAKIDCEIYKQYALDKQQLLDLRVAADRHFTQFTIRLRNAYPRLTSIDIDYCCLNLLNLTHADISALMQRAYNTVVERDSKIQKVFDTEKPLLVFLMDIAQHYSSI